MFNFFSIQSLLLKPNNIEVGNELNLTSPKFAATKRKAAKPCTRSYRPRQQKRLFQPLSYHLELERIQKHLPSFDCQFSNPNLLNTGPSSSTANFLESSQLTEHVELLPQQNFYTDQHVNYSNFYPPMPQPNSYYPFMDFPTQNANMSNEMGAFSQQTQKFNNALEQQNLETNVFPQQETPMIDEFQQKQEMASEGFEQNFNAYLHQNQQQIDGIAYWQQNQDCMFFFQ